MWSTDVSPRPDNEPRLPDNRVFEACYALPDDQLRSELDILADYEARFPAAVPVLQRALRDLGCFAGDGSPVFRIAAEQVTEARAIGIVVEQNYLRQQDNTASGFAMVALQAPVRRTRESYDALSEAGKYAAQVGDSGLVVVGNLPPEARALVEGLYALTGASVVRDGRQEGDDPGSILRRGAYHGSTIYFSEEYDDAGSYLPSLSTFKLLLLTEVSAASQLVALNAAEEAAFMAVSGVRRHELMDTLVAFGIDRRNYTRVARRIGHMFSRIRDIVDPTAS